MQETSYEKRNKDIRNRINDALHQIGHGDLDGGKDRFIDHAIWCAGRRGMRLWKSDSRDRMKQVAHRSLGTLLCEVKVCKGANEWTGRNVAWVLDIWEVALDDWFNVHEVPVVGQETTSNLTRAIEERKPLSLRILEAYIARDDDAIVKLAEEVEAR